VAQWADFFARAQVARVWTSVGRVEGCVARPRAAREAADGGSIADDHLSDAASGSAFERARLVGGSAAEPVCTKQTVQARCRSAEFTPPPPPQQP